MGPTIDLILQSAAQTIEAPKRSRFRHDHGRQKYKELRVQEKIQQYLTISEKQYKKVRLIDFMKRMDETNQYHSINNIPCEKLNNQS